MRICWDIVGVALWSSMRRGEDGGMSKFLVVVCVPLSRISLVEKTKLCGPFCLGIFVVSERSLSELDRWGGVGDRVPVWVYHIFWHRCRVIVA